ncbi:MAG: GDP-L-fucose synthase [Phycisphaerales bacterium]|nr:GDP-L-fucose synthase [Phycisphaerales bacterium]
MQQHDRVYVAGHRGLVGSAIVRRLAADGFSNLILRTRESLDLRDRGAVDRFFAATRPQFVFLAAATVGGIHANDSRGGEFIRDNLLIQTHVIDAAHRFGASKLLFLGSSCIYPRSAEQPMREESLLTGPLEPTNAPYAVAKSAGIQMCQAYRRQHGFDANCAMPANLYGPGDNFDLEQSHVLPALIRKFHDAREACAASVTLWGTGEPRREFLHVDDLADAAVILMREYSDERIVNVGTGEEVRIRDLAAMIAEVVGFRGEIVWDRSRPDGVPRKVLDLSRIGQLGWQARVGLMDGLRRTYAWYCETLEAGGIIRQGTFP